MAHPGINRIDGAGFRRAVATLLLPCLSACTGPMVLDRDFRPARMSAGDVLGADALGLRGPQGSGEALGAPRHSSAPPPGRNALSPYLEFYAQRRIELAQPGLPEPRRRVGQRALPE